MTRTAPPAPAWRYWTRADTIGWERGGGGGCSDAMGRAGSRCRSWHGPAGGRRHRVGGARRCLRVGGLGLVTWRWTRTHAARRRRRPRRRRQRGTGRGPPARIRPATSESSIDAGRRQPAGNLTPIRSNFAVTPDSWACPRSGPGRRPRTARALSGLGGRKDEAPPLLPAWAGSYSGDGAATNSYR